MAFKVPDINITACQEWTVQDNQLYARLDEWFVLRDQKFRKRYGEWTKVFGRIKFTPNMGENVRQLIQEPPPNLRQHAFGSPLCGPAKVDITQFRERTAPINMVRHKFRSPAFCWCPSFYDFVKNNVQKNLTFVQQSQQIFEQLFYRSAVFHGCPTVVVADGADSTALGTGYSAGVHYTAPQGSGSEDGTTAKSLNYLEVIVPLVGNPGNLSMRTVIKACNVLSEDLGAIPYQDGKVSENSPLDEKYLLITSAEAYDQFADDPLYKENRSETEDAIRNGFHGLIRNRVTVNIQSHPLRMLRAANGDITWPQPQTIIEDPSHPQYGQTVPDLNYRAAQYEVAFLFGHQPFDIVEVGAPPQPFAGKGMNWNGEVMLSTDFLVECLSDPLNQSTITKEFNTEKEWLKLFSTLALGISPVNPRNCVVILFRRKRDTSTFLF